MPDLLVCCRSLRNGCGLPNLDLRRPNASLLGRFDGRARPLLRWAPPGFVESIEGLHSHESARFDRVEVLHGCASSVEVHDVLHTMGCVDSPRTGDEYRPAWSREPCELLLSEPRHLLGCHGPDHRGTYLRSRTTAGSAARSAQDSPHLRHCRTSFSQPASGVACSDVVNRS